MNTITVPKAKLLETLHQNRDEHRSIFEKAQGVYRDRMVEELDRALKEAREGGKIKRGFTLPVPEDHTSDFDTAIQMLEWHTEETIELTQREFMQYIENQWGWAASFVANTQSYLAE